MPAAAAIIANTLFHMPHLNRGGGKYEPVHPEEYRTADQVGDHRCPDTRTHSFNHKPKDRGAQLPADEIKNETFHGQVSRNKDTGSFMAFSYPGFLLTKICLCNYLSP